MSRVKTFDATGVSPNGRLFAGDLNAMQDHYADLSNFLQTHDVGTLRIGDTTLQLLKFGASEFRATGAFRVDGILRGLGGLYAGAFTTTQRDAIIAGQRPYGLVILNTTTNRYEWNQGTDPAPIWVALGGPAVAGTLGSRPAASPANAGQIYFATDDNGGTWYLSTGTAWIVTTNGLNKITRGILSARPVANTVPAGNVYVATDDHGGTSHESDGTSWQKMGASVFGEVPIGAVIDWPWAIANAPGQFIACYGQAISRTVNAELHALALAAGYPHGTGDGTTTFNVPDYRGRDGLGLDNMGGVAANRISVAISGIAGTTLGGAGGVEGITLTIAQMPAHNHAYTAPQGPVGKTDGGQSAVPNVVATVTGNTGGGGVHSNVQPGIMVFKIMRAG